MKQPLGIIGGIGAFAGLRLADYLLKLAHDRGASRDDEFPDFLLYNLPIHGMDERGIYNQEIVLVDLLDAMLKMEAWGCKRVILACNTVHCLLPEIELRFPSMVINMLESACKSVSQNVSRVGVISSDTTRALGLYRSALSRNRIGIVETTDDEQKLLNEAIKEAVAGRQLKCHFDFVENTIVSMNRRGADEIIVGCTDLPLVLNPDHLSIRLIDAGHEAIKQAFDE